MKYLISLLNQILIQNFDQSLNGMDWPSIDIGEPNECGQPGQSPINLFTNAKRLPAIQKFIPQYQNETNVTSTLFHHTNSFAFADTNSQFQSDQEKIIGAGSTFKAINFHWHAGSEHTIDGHRYDAEIHIEHTPETDKDIHIEHTPDTDVDDDKNNNKFKFAVIGIIFDREFYHEDVSLEQEQAIDDFFDDLQMRNLKDQSIGTLRIGDLMDKLDHNDRFSQTGSLTTPPCSRKVAWNVLKKVQPIKQRHQDQFMLQLNRDNQDSQNTRINGNFRLTQDQNTQNLKIMGHHTWCPNGCFTMPWFTNNNVVMSISIIFMLIIIIVMLYKQANNKNILIFDNKTSQIEIADKNLINNAKQTEENVKNEILLENN